jgi:hypothetical protein
VRPLAALLVVLLVACGDAERPQRDDSALPTEPATTSTTTTEAPETVPPEPGNGVAAEQVHIRLRLERRVADPATETFEEVVRSTLTDPRGWEQAGFRFSFAADAPYSVVLAEGSEVDDLCHPYTTGGRFSCQMGPVVALNADRWRHATDRWTGDLATYRLMLVNHEVGHLLGQHHPEPQCPRPAEPAPVMAQQSTELGDCLPNPWPLPWEIDCAAVHEEPLAPGYEPDVQATCGP